MMARPVDWLPLADSDPVPGDPQRISEQAAHLASTAQELSGQVARLRAIAAGHSAEQGLHADKLRSASSDVAGGLEKVVGAAAGSPAPTERACGYQDFLGIEGQWDDLERACTTPGGLTTAQANFLVNVAQFTPLGLAASAFRVFWGGGW